MYCWCERPLSNMPICITTWYHFSWETYCAMYFQMKFIVLTVSYVGKNRFSYEQYIMSRITLLNCETFLFTSSLRCLHNTSLSWYSISWENTTLPFFYSPWHTLGHVDSTIYGAPKSGLTRRQVHYQAWLSNGYISKFSFINLLHLLTVHYCFVILGSREVSSIWGFCFAKIWTKTRNPGCGEGRDT